MEEAPLEEGPAGLAPAGEGWFVVNVRDAAWRTHDTFGASTRFEDLAAEFPHLGICVRVLEPGQPNCLYHREAGQEDFLVLRASACRRRGRGAAPTAWDFVHCPPGPSTSSSGPATGRASC